MKRKKDSGVYAYLAASGVLDTGTLEDIANAKKAYWAIRKNEWKKEKRKKEQPFTVAYTDSELKVITSTARKHNISRTAYIKLASLSYPTLTYIVPNGAAIASIKEALYKNYNSLYALLDQEALPAEIAVQAIQRMELLEALILSQLLHPQISNNDH